MGYFKIYGPVYRQLTPNSGYTTRELFCMQWWGRSAFVVGRAILPAAAFQAAFSGR
jgi:hypothetical protein